MDEQKIFGRRSSPRSQTSVNYYRRPTYDGFRSGAPSQDFAMSHTIARLTLDQYDRMIAAGIFDDTDRRRIEFIHGELREMTPMGPEHEKAVDYLNEWSFELLPKGAVWVRVQNSVGLIELESAPEPDLVWVARRNYATRPTAEDVLLVAEVAMSSLSYDRGEKATLYASAGVRDYWVVNLIARQIEVHREPRDAAYQSIEICVDGDTLSPIGFPQSRLDVRQLSTHVWAN